jgi:hypothetical protein
MDGDAFEVVKEVHLIESGYRTRPPLAQYALTRFRLRLLAVPNCTVVSPDFMTA